MNPFDTINSHTGFANGDRFSDPEQVREYFTPEAQMEMFGADAVTDAEVLSEWAETVIANRWHMRQAPETLTEAIEAFDEQEGTHRTEGRRGVENLCRLVNAMGYADPQHFGQFDRNGSYGDLIEFLQDNSGCIEAIRNWIEAQEVEEWRKNLTDRLTESAES